MDVSDTSDYSGSNFSSLSHTIFNEDVFDVKTQLLQLSGSSKDDSGYKNDLDNLEKVIELKFYKKFDKLMRLNVQLESQLSSANKFINSLQNDTILDSELKKLNFDLNFKINDLECELKALKCNIENDEKLLDSLRRENEEKSVLIDMKSNSIAGLKNKIVELHLELLESKQASLKSEHVFAVLTNELNAVKKSETWYKNSLCECRLQKSAMIEEITNLQLQLITKNRNLKLEALKHLDHKQKSHQIELLTNELLEAKETCNCQKITLDRVYGENQNLNAKLAFVQSKLSENEILMCNLQNFNETIENSSCTFTYPTADVAVSETDLCQITSSTVNNEQNTQITLKQLEENLNLTGETNRNCGIEPAERKNSVTSAMAGKEDQLDQERIQDSVKTIFNLDAEVRALKESDTFNKNLLMVEIQKHEETVAELGIQYMALQNEVGDLKESNFKYFSELENLQITFQEVQEANKSNEDQVKAMRLENQNLKLEKLCLRTENENLIKKQESEIEELKENLNTKQDFMDKIETENGELRTTRNVEKQKHEETIAELGMQFDDLLTQFEDLQDANNRYQIETSTFGKEIEELKSYIDTSDQLLIDIRAKEEMAKQDLCGQILHLYNKIEECQNQHDAEVKSKEDLMKELKKEEETKKELQVEVSSLQNEIRKCKCNSEVIVLQNMIEELKTEIEIKENLVIRSREETERIKDVEIKLISEVESMQNLIGQLKSDADFKDQRWISAEENQDRLARQVLVLQDEILQSEAIKKTQIENIRTTSIELARSNDSILNLVMTLNNENDDLIRKLENENFDLKHNCKVETENLHEIIGKLTEELQIQADMKLPKPSFGGKNILFESVVMDDSSIMVPNLVQAERDENIFFKSEVKRLSALCKAKEMQNEENREKCEKGNRSLLNEIKEYKRRCAKMEKLYKQISEEFNSYKFSNLNKQIECSCDNYKNTQVGVPEIFVQNGRTENTDEKITTNQLTPKTALKKDINKLHEEIDILQEDLISTRSDKFFLQRLCKDLKFSLESCNSQAKMLKKQNDILKSLDCRKLLSKIPSPNKCDDTFIKELIKSSCQYQNPIRNLENSMGLFKEEVVRLQKFVS